MEKGAVLWFCGLPGSGKSSIARAMLAALHDAGLNPLLLEMDSRRKVYFPKPEYSEAEREAAYARLGDEAAALAGEGELVLVDATAHRVSFREHCRAKTERFGEIFVRCSLKTAMSREAARPEGKVMAGLYAKAMRRKAFGEEFPGLGQVIGVDLPFEEDPDADLVIDSESQSPAQAAGLVIERFKAWLK